MNPSIERCNQEQREIEARGEDAPDGYGAAMGWADWEVEKWLSRPLCIDLFCGLGGWTEGFLAEGWNVIGFDNHRHEYGEARYPAQLVIQDVLTLHGSQFRNADCIVASPPCQRYSWMAMPWSLAKREASWQRWQRDSTFSTGFDLNDLFDACFRIQREASEAAGRKIPMVVENVKGAQPWVGKAKAHFGSYYLWGDVESVGGRIVCGLRPRFGETIQARRLGDALKVPGINWSGYGKPGYKPQGFNVTAAQRYREENGTKQGGGWWHDPESISVKTSSRSDSRKAASAEIAKIPFPLSRWIAQVMRPAECRSARDVHGPDGAQNGALTTNGL